MNPNTQPNTQSGEQARSANNPAQASIQDAISLLRADHDKVQQLFADFLEAGDDAEKMDLAQTICYELKLHTAIEEEIFYPAARDAIDDDSLLDEAAVEHDAAKELIAQIEEGSPDDDKWEAKVNVLSAYVNHHINEEQNKIFPEVQASDMDLDELGEEMAERKQDLIEEFEDDSNDLDDDDDDDD